MLVKVAVAYKMLLQLWQIVRTLSVLSLELGEWLVFEWLYLCF